MADTRHSGFDADGLRLQAARYRRWALVGIAGIMIVLTIMIIWLYPLLRAMQLAVFDIDQSGGPDPGVNLTEVADHTSAVLGEEVTISGRIDQILGPHALVIGNQTPFVGETVLVVSRQPISTLIETPVDQTDSLRVTGVVQRFQQDQLERELGVPLSAEDLEERTGDPTIVASSALANPPFAIGPGDKEFSALSDFFDVAVTVEDILDDPQSLVGRQVTVSAEVEEGLLTPHLFWIDDERLLIISPEPRNDVIIEATAIVIGEVRLFDRNELGQEFDIPLQQLEDYSGEAVVVAERVELIK